MITLALHVLFAWILLNGIALRTVKVLGEPIHVRLMAEVPRVKEIEPLVSPVLGEPPLPEIELPAITIEETPAPRRAPILIGPSVTPRATQRRTVIGPHLDPNRPLSQPNYTGAPRTVELLLTVDETGRVIAANVTATSGDERLDAATVKEALRAWRMLPGTIDGRPARMQTTWHVTFFAVSEVARRH